MTTPDIAPAPQPDGEQFETNEFSILHLAQNEGGFDFRTNDTLGRTGALTPEEHLVLSDPEKSQLKGAMAGEMKFAKSQIVEDARRAWRDALAANEPAERVEELHQTFLGEREKYFQKGKKIGFRAINREGDTLSADVQIVSFPVFNTFAYPNTSAEMGKLSTGGGTAMMVRTKDNRILVQHRAVQTVNLDKPGVVRGNATFGDVPGASAGGWQDASLKGEGRTPGTPDPLSAEDIKSGAMREVAEELGLDRKDLSKARIVGIARDKVRPADVFLMLADSDLTANELKQRSKESALNKGNGDADFEEKFIDIDGSAEAIETLLTEVRCPIPPAHAANLLASGYYLVLQEQGQEAADIWKNEMHSKIVENYRNINQMVSDFYDKFPEAFIQVPERYIGKGVPRRNSVGYEPAYTPEEQGLPTFEDEMVRVGLMPERRTRVDEAALFDFDDMLNAAKENGTIPEQAVAEIAEELRSGKPVGINSAHPTGWLIENVVRPLQGRVPQDVLKNFIAIGEDGGTWATFNEAGELYRGQSPTVKKPNGVEDRIRDVVDRYPELLEIDNSKQTMISIDVVSSFSARQSGRGRTASVMTMELHNELTELFAAMGTERSYAMTTSGNTIHITDRNVGKGFGANRFLELLKYRDIVADKIAVHVDNGFGIQTVDELERRQHAVEVRQSTLALAA